MKKRTKSIISATACILLLTAGVGAIGTATKGFKDWKVDNWGQNFKDIISKDKTDEEKGETEQVNALSVDKTDSEKTYIMPSSSINFGNSLASDDEVEVSKEDVVINSLSTQSVSRGVALNNDLTTRSKGSAITLPQEITLKAILTPTEASYDTILWEVSWGDESTNISDFITLENSTGLNCKVIVSKAFTNTATLKVTVTKNGLPVSATCKIEYYKQLEGIEFNLTNQVADKVLNKGDLITYNFNPIYGDGTVSQLDDSEETITYTSLISEYTINYDFKKNEKEAFDINVFYGSNDNFTGLTIYSGKGRNLMNAKLQASTGDFSITAKKGSYSKSIDLDIEYETDIYPESVVIGDGNDIEIGKN